MVSDLKKYLPPLGFVEILIILSIFGLLGAIWAGKTQQAKQKELQTNSCTCNCNK